MSVRDKTLAAFGRNVARIRDERGFSQDKLAEKADLDRTYLSGIERGVRNPGIKVVIRIARALGSRWTSSAKKWIRKAAGTIHTDIQKGFIRAEIISFADLVAAGGETQAKRAGKQRLELKTYVMQDYDVANFRFNK